jgi:hypothetical protein
LASTPVGERGSEERGSDKRNGIERGRMTREKDVLIDVDSFASRGISICESAKILNLLAKPYAF